MWSLLVFQFHYIGEFSSGPVLGFSWYWIQICWKSVPGVTINFPCDQAPGWMTDSVIDRVSKCQIFNTEQISQTKFYPKKSA